MFYYPDTPLLLRQRPDTQRQTTRPKMSQSEKVIKNTSSSPQSPVVTTYRRNIPRRQKEPQSSGVELDFLEVNRIQRIEKAYNRISNLDDKEQIWKSLKKVHNLEERIVLVDKILKRKNEVKQMKEKMSMYKLAPIFQILINKVNKKKEKDRLLSSKCN